MKDQPKLPESTVCSSGRWLEPHSSREESDKADDEAYDEVCEMSGLQKRPTHTAAVVPLDLDKDTSNRIAGILTAATCMALIGLRLPSRSRKSKASALR